MKDDDIYVNSIFVLPILWTPIKTFTYLQDN